jgi:hypothetical protein
MKFGGLRGIIYLAAQRKCISFFKSGYYSAANLDKIN